MNLKHTATLLLLLIPVFLLAKDEPTSGPRWHIKGAMSSACSCAVPCTCTFGRGPSPHRYCYGMDSYKIEQGSFNEIPLNGLKFGIVRAKYAKTLYLDQSASPVQRAALMQIANEVMGLKNRIYPSGTSAPLMATRDARMTQEYDERGNHVKFGDDGEFRARYLIGLDRKTPIVVKNNPDIDVPDEIKGYTEFSRYALGRNRFSFKNTNSSQGAFEYDSSQYESKLAANNSKSN
jgi:hypothetical protein